MQPAISRIALYVRDIPQIAAFYQKHFDLEIDDAGGDFTCLQSKEGGCALILLQASKGHKIGQSCIKIVFDVPDVAAFKEQSREAGLVFGAIHQADGYEYANAHDPAKNPIQISNRRFKKTAP
jgi:predicted enzyme related to lactoylglutathione lyase